MTENELERLGATIQEQLTKAAESIHAFGIRLDEMTEALQTLGAELPEGPTDLEELEAVAKERWPGYPNVLVKAYTPAKDGEERIRRQWKNVQLAARALDVTPAEMLPWLLEEHTQPYWTRDERYPQLGEMRLFVKEVK